MERIALFLILPDKSLLFPAKRIDFIATDFYKIAITLTAIFGSAQYCVVSELIVCGEVGFYLCVLGGTTLSMRISSAVCIACICVLFHYFLELVSKSEVRVRMRYFQAFRTFLHNIALVRCKILRETGCQKEHLSSH